MKSKAWKISEKLKKLKAVQHLNLDKLTLNHNLSMQECKKKKETEEACY